MPHLARTRWRRSAVVAALLALTWFAMTEGQPGPERPDSRTTHEQPAPDASPPAVHRDPVQPDPVQPDPRPTELEIEAIDVSTPLISLGLNKDRTVEVPTDPDDAGWYRLGPAPGLPGSAVILGHVDSERGPAVFARLRTLEPGAIIVVTHADGSRSRFAVRSVATYANDDFPAARVYRNHGTPTLTLVTCGGAYDAANGGYQANVVVTAALVGRAEAPLHGQAVSAPDGVPRVGVEPTLNGV